MRAEEADRIRELAQQLLALSADQITDLIVSNGETTEAWDDTEHSDFMLQLAIVSMKRRRARTRLLPPAVTSDAAWMILLDLFVRQASDKSTSVTSACLAAGCAPTTGLRYVSLLLDEKLISRFPDPHDLRRTNLELTQEGRQLIERVLDAERRAQ